MKSKDMGGLVRSLALGVALAFSAGCAHMKYEEGYDPTPRMPQKIADNAYVVSPLCMNIARSLIGVPYATAQSITFEIANKQQVLDAFTTLCKRYGLTNDEIEAYFPVLFTQDVCSFLPEALCHGIFEKVWAHEEFHRVYKTLPEEKKNIFRDTHAKIVASIPIRYDASCPPVNRGREHLERLESIMKDWDQEFYPYLSHCPQLAEKYLSPYPEVYKLFNGIKSQARSLPAVEFAWRR